MVKIGQYNYEKSTNPKKKLMVVVNGKKIFFGAREMEQFKDKTGIWKSKDHNDPKRRKNYLARSAGIKRKDGSLTKDDPTSSNYHSRRILWNA
tara:strand:- start:5224 stop:5502 length:279 start_codon:yes stop_codon:yes gene_type:complete